MEGMPVERSTATDLLGVDALATQQVNSAAAHAAH
jgi:hypothetical protein